jgi:BirA family transcriptional regulator, biotin operon repressor / biotin---[acetyl-CoA-carboxylase] ligase
MRRNSPLGEVLIELSEIDSTNNYAMRLINEGMAEHGMTIRTDFQTQGKGQHGNNWFAEERKNLLCTVIIDTQGFDLGQQFLLNTFACLAVAEYLMIQEQLPAVSIKWPNDIYAGNRKIAGILIENCIRGSNWTNAIIGIGLNVNQGAFPDLNWATSMHLETGKVYKINTVLKQLIKYLNNAFHLFTSNPSNLIEAYNQLLYKRGMPVLFKRTHETYEGILQCVEENGQLRISVNGKDKLFNHKEIELMLG